MSPLELKSFRAPSMREALAQVRQEFGPEAVILHTRQLTHRGLMGSRTTTVEVTASRGVSTSKASAPTPVLHHSGKSADASAAPGEPAVSALRKQLDFLAEMVEEIYRHQDQAKIIACDPVGQRLKGLEFPAPLAAELVRALRARGLEPDPSKSETAEFLISSLAARIRTTDAAETCFATPLRAALVGPTGCGKTLTIAKLAAAAKFDRGKTVALATVDVQRVAAPRQLQTIAEILDVPFGLANSPSELAHVIERWRDVDVLLIDTPGCSPTDTGRIADLAEFLPAGVCVHLVLAANLRESLLDDAIARFQPVGYRRLIATKLDEVSASGVIGFLAERSAAPVSFITCGQTVPDDIEPADSRRLAELALGYRGGIRSPGRRTADSTAKRQNAQETQDRLGGEDDSRIELARSRSARASHPPSLPRALVLQGTIERRPGRKE